MCTTWWCLCSFSLNSLLNFAHFKVQTSFAAHQPICHLSSLPLSYLSRPCAVMAQRLIVSVFTSQGALESLFTDYKISFFVSFSELTPLSWPSQGRSHALLHAINLRRKSETSSHAICFHPLPFCAFDKFPVKYHIHFFLFHSSCSINKHRLTDNRLTGFYTKVAANAAALRVWKVDIIKIMWNSQASIGPHVCQLYKYISPKKKTNNPNPYSMHTSKICFCSLLCPVATFLCFKRMHKTLQSDICIFSMCTLTNWKNNPKGCRDRLQPSYKSLQTPTI